MTMHWVEKYIWADWRWMENGQGPDTWNCWHFVREVQRAEFGRDLPVVPVGDAQTVAAVMSGWLPHSNWRKRLAQTPVEGDVIVMMGMDLHVGIWADVDGGGVLHCARGLDVIFTPPSLAELHGFRIERLWGYVAS